MQNGAVAIVFSLAALVINIILMKYDDKMYLYKDIPDLYADASVSSGVYIILFSSNYPFWPQIPFFFHAF